MSTINSLATLTDFKNWLSVRGLAGSVGTDAIDDAVIESLLMSASRYADGERTFYPRVETRYYNVPNGPELLLDDDLLDLTTLTNGEGTVIAPTDYLCEPYNSPPYYKVRLRDTATVNWLSSAAGSWLRVVQVLGWWGYRERFSQRAWLAGGTLGAAIADTTTLAFTMTAGHSLVAGQVIKIGSEIYNIGSISTNTITPIARGDNGSTAATHSNGLAVYIWQPMEDIKSAVLQIVGNMYSARSGQSSGGRITVTASGIVIRPEDVPPLAQKTLDKYRRLC